MTPFLQGVVSPSHMFICSTWFVESQRKVVDAGAGLGVLLTRLYPYS